MPDPNPPLVQEHTLTLRSLPSSVPEEIRMRGLLKAAMRRFGFKLVDYRAVDVPVKPSPAKGAGGGARA